MKSRHYLTADSPERLRVNGLLFGIACLALGSVIAFAQTASSGNPDQQFVDFAAQTDMLEAHFGQMALNQASGRNIKDFAQILVTDHTNDYQQLNRLSEKAGVTVPKAIDAKGNKTIATFEKLKGTAFDSRFIREMISGHEKAIDTYKKEISNGQNSDVKAYAAQAMPALERHLQGARQLKAARTAPVTP